jgi:phytoene dehydrogenase-like protein
VCCTRCIGALTASFGYISQTLYGPGAKDIRQLVFGPRMTLSPYSLGVPGMYICSAATPPGPGAHGMCGANAASSALAYLENIR